ncbi:MAG: hypothetical protein ABIJ91_05125 [Candidatus Kuenenbacteria bacterium]
MMHRKPKLSKTLFWDVKATDIDFDEHKKYVVQRVLMLGDGNDWQEIKKYYGLKNIAKIAVQIKDLDKKSCNFWSLIFNIPKSKFLCSKNHWRQQRA